MTTPAIPSTPHNQKRDSQSGPVPNLISTLRHDNRDQLIALLKLDPHSNDVSLAMTAPDTSTTSNSNGVGVRSDVSTAAGHAQQPIAHRQRLVFATDSLRKLLLYHTLFQPDHNQKKNAAKRGMTKTSNSHLNHDELALGLDAYNPFGIVNTRILFPNNHITGNTTLPLHSDVISNNGGGGGIHGANGEFMTTSTTTNMQGTETIYNPLSSNSSGKNNHPSSLFNIHHDLIHDENGGKDAVSVILYFILPLPDHVKAVCKIIQGYTHESSTSIPSRRKNSFPTNNPFEQQQQQQQSNQKVKHRIVFLTRCTKLCTQILYNENILPLPEYNNDNIGSSNHHRHHHNTSSVLVNIQKNVVVHDLDIDLVPIEDDILTLLDTSCVLKDVSSINGIPSMHVNSVASSIMKIQSICNNDDDGDNSSVDDGMGYIPRIQTFGKISESVLRRCFDLRREEYYDISMSTSNKENYEDESGCDQKYYGGGDIQAMMIIDRRIDMVTPMLTPLTYEGLLDDALSIETGILHVKTDIISPPEDEDDSNKSKTDSIGSLSRQTKKSDKKEKPFFTLLPLNDQDTLYVEVRDQHVEKFGKFLQEQAKALKESHANFSNKDKDLTEIHMFVKQIPIFTQNLKSLTHHIHLAELIKHTTMQSEFRQRWQLERSILESESCFDAIEDLIASQFNVWRVLRLMCLHSLANGGIKSSKLDTLKRDVVQTYGYEFVFLLQNLETIGLLRKKDTLWDTSSSSAYGTLRKQLKLIQPDVDPNDPDDVSYVSSGYAPISSRIIQTAVEGWTGKEDVLKELPGRVIDVEQKYPPEEYGAALKRSIGSPLGTWVKQLMKLRKQAIEFEHTQKKKPVLLVYFVGGVTYAEIAAIRFLSKRSGFPFTIVCCTTKIINGTSLLQSLV